jgi:hypothetical protein
MTTPSDPNQQQALTPQTLANQLFDAAVTHGRSQNMTDPREAGRWVARFLADSLYYAITSTKDDPVVFLTETLIYVASASVGGDEAARKELLKHIGDTIANAPPIPVNKPAVGKP